MHVKEHVKLSAAASLVALPWLKQDVIIPFTASILIDVDHYLWHAVEHRTFSLRTALRYFSQADPPRLARQRLLHHPLILALLLVVAVHSRSRFLSLILAGLLFHVSLDFIHVSQMNHLKQSLSEQANYTCPKCGQHQESLQLHTVKLASNILDRYNPQHFVVLCPACHTQAHRGNGALPKNSRRTLKSMI